MIWATQTIPHEGEAIYIAPPSLQHFLSRSSLFIQSALNLHLHELINQYLLNYMQDMVCD